MTIKKRIPMIVNKSNSRASFRIGKIGDKRNGNNMKKIIKTNTPVHAVSAYIPKYFLR